jgi:hypothetical protein
MTVSTSRHGTGAKGLISGTVSNGATWRENLEITEDGTFITDAPTFEWRMTFRQDSDSPVLTLSTTDGTLTVTNSASATTVAIVVAYTSLSDLEGDYICDLASLDTSTTPDDLVHWAHGVVSFRDEPIWSS